METTLSQQLKVVEVFRFADGRTVFVGPFDGGAKYIPPCDAELIVNDHSLTVLHIEGEMMLDRKHPMGYRSVSTTAMVDLNALSPMTDEVRLRIKLSSNAA